MKKTNLLRLILLFVLSISVSFVLVSCDFGDGGETYEGPYTIIFDSNGGSEVDSVTVARGELIPEPEDPRKPGFLFRGWYNGTMKWNFESEFYGASKNMTLVAKWEASDEQYVVSYDSAGGSVVATYETVLAGATAPEPYERPKRDGYRFAGWYCGEELWDFNTLITADTTLVAHWIPKLDNLVYDPETTPLHLVYSTSGISKERDNAIYDLFTHLSGILYTEPTLAKDGDRVPIDNEIVVGRTIRIISNKAYGILDAMEREEGEKLFLVYVERSRWEELDVDGEVIYGSEPILSENGYSAAIAYDASEGDSVAVAAINYFIENLAGEELAHAPGVVCVGRISADGTLSVTNSQGPSNAPSLEDDPESLKIDFEALEPGASLPEGIEIAGEAGAELDPYSGVYVWQKRNGGKYLLVSTWDTYVDPETKEWNGWENYRKGYANTDVIFRPQSASETESYFVVSFDINAREFRTISDGAGDKKAAFLKFFDTEGNEKALFKICITHTGYVIIPEDGGYPASVNLRENANLRFVYSIEDGKLYCYCDGVMFAAVDYGTAGEAASLGYMRLDFMNSLVSRLEIDNIIVANNVARVEIPEETPAE